MLSEIVVECGAYIAGKKIFVGTRCYDVARTCVVYNNVVNLQAFAGSCFLEDIGTKQWPIEKLMGRLVFFFY